MIIRAVTAVVGILAGLPAAAVAQCDTQRLTRPWDEVPHFGIVTEIEAGRLFIAAPHAWTGCSTPDPFSCAAGATYVYERAGDRWVLQQMITPFDIDVFDFFGMFDVHGDRMLISSAATAFVTQPGQIHDFRYNPDLGQWVEHDRIQAHVTGPPDPTYPGVGRPSWSTSLLLFRFGDDIQRFIEDDEGSWEYRETISPPDGMERANFADAIEVNEDWVVFNAPLDSTFGDRLGSVYVYRRNPDDSIEFFQKLLPVRGPGPEGYNRYYGTGIALDGDRLAVGSVGVTVTVGGQGAVYVYRFDGAQWILEQEVLQADPRLGSNMGQSVDLEGDVMIVGSQRQDDRHADVFRRGPDGVWRQAAVLTPEIPNELPIWTRDFGWDVAMDGRLLAVGAPGEQPSYPTSPRVRPGAIYAYDLACYECTPDLDGDGELTVFDFLTFLNAFDAADPIADLDGDGELTLFDFLAFQTAFDAGCE